MPFEKAFQPRLQPSKPSRVNGSERVTRTGGCGVRVAEVGNRISEEPQSIALRGQPLARPPRVLRRQNVSLGMRHQTEHSTGRVADARYVALGAVRIMRVAGVELPGRVDV